MFELRIYSIQGQINLWIKSFLSGRTQSVVMDGKNSSPFNVLSGIPQGSVLGPLLFLIFINHIVNDVSSNINLFVDICTLFRRINTIDDSVTLQNDFNKLYTWSRRWNMEFNVTKCYSITITLTRNNIQNDYHI